MSIVGLILTLAVANLAPQEDGFLEKWSSPGTKFHELVEQDESDLPVVLSDEGAFFLSNDGTVQKKKKFPFQNTILKFDKEGVPKHSIEATRQMKEGESVMFPGRSSYYMQNNVYYTLNTGMTLNADSFSWTFQSEPSSSAAVVTADHKKIIHLAHRDPVGTFMSVVESEMDDFGFPQMTVKVDRRGIRTDRWGDIGIFDGFNDLCILDPTHVVLLGSIDIEDYTDKDTGGLQFKDYRHINIGWLSGRGTQSIFLIVMNTKFGIGTPVARYTKDGSGERGNYSAGRMRVLGSYLYMSCADSIYRVKVADLVKMSKY